MRQRVVVALGGNALLERDEPPDARIQRRHIARAAEALARLARDHDLLVCHGNGPQVGLLALESEADTSLERPYPLDVLVAQTQGMIGYWLGQELHNAGLRQGIVTIVTQTVVDPADPAFARPSKFIGAVYEEDVARELAVRHGWSIARDGQRWRRVVASPEPVGFVEEQAVRALLGTHAVVICGGGGGAAVVRRGDRLDGVEAVVDKDLVAALMAERFEADRLLVLTDVEAVMRDFGTPDQQPIRRLMLDELAAMSFPAGSMGPKIEACRRFTATSGHDSAIGRLGEAAAVLGGRAGTTVAVRPAQASSSRSNAQVSSPDASRT